MQGGVVGDGIVFALSDYLPARADDFVSLTLAVPTYLASDNLDLLKAGLEWIYDKIRKPLRIHEDSIIQEEKELDLALGAVFESVAMQQYDGPRPINMHNHLLRQQLRTKAAEIMGVSNDRFTEVTREWWKKNQNIIYNIYNSNNTFVGVTGVLPLTADCYERIKSGQIREIDIPVEDILLKSTRFLIFAGADRSYAIKPDWQVISLLMSVGFLTHLVHATSKETLRELRCLSFGGTPDNEQRLKSVGFQPVNVCMKGTTLPLLEYTTRNENAAMLKRMVNLIRMAQ